jgi:hypothetical protein
VFSTEFDEDMVNYTRPHNTEKRSTTGEVDGKPATITVYVIGQQYHGSLTLPPGVKCVQVVNYDEGGQDIVVRAEHHEFHKPRPEMLSDKVHLEKSKEVNMDTLLGYNTNP